MPRVVFRADGSSQTGLGHIYRCLALVEIVKRTFSCLFVIKSSSEQFGEFIAPNCDLLILGSVTLDSELHEMEEILKTEDILVLDGYQFDVRYQQRLKKCIGQLVMLDDKADHQYIADLIINQGDGGARLKYKITANTKLLLGFKYLIARPPFLDSAAQSRVISKVDTAFICMGGADPFNVTIKALEACCNTGFVKKIIVVTGSAYRNLKDLQKFMKEQKSCANIVHHQNISAQVMISLIREAEIAICTASSVAMEVCCVKSGLVSGTVIDNQEGTLHELETNNLCVSVGDFNSASVQQISECIKRLEDLAVVRKMIHNQAKSFDGRSGERILNEFKILANA